MKSDRLIEAMENIDDKFILEAKSETKRHYKSWLKYGTAAAAVALVITITALYNNSDTGSSKSWPVKDVVISQTTDSEIDTVKPWDEMTISQKYGEFSYENGTYVSRDKQVSSEELGDYLDVVEIEGYDPVNSKSYTKEFSVYEIKGISSACGVLIELEPGQYYSYVNYSYKPETLEQFMQDINWEKNVEYGPTYYNLYEDDEYKQLIFEDVSTEKIQDLLNTNKALATLDQDSVNTEGEQLSISIDIPVFGYSNIGIWISKDGYMGTNILDTGKCYNIGDEAANDFINYVINECTGYEVHYVNDTPVEE